MAVRTQRIIAIILVIVFLAGSFRFATVLNAMREDFQLSQMTLPAQARPDLLTSVLFSVGRALAVDYLWIGLQKMKMEGRYFDANQRAEWICQLQPHFPAVWVYQAWNMAYNISVAMDTGEDRWRWVKNGYELLRDRGIPLNPKSVVMYQQLAWIFHHKIGALSDEWHWYYKSHLARAMEAIVGRPGEVQKYDIMAEAPRTWDELVKLPNMRQFIADIEAFELDPKKDFLAILAHRERYGEKVLALVDDPKYEHCRRMLEGYLRAKWLYDEWKLDIKIIEQLRSDDMYGPLDFRTAQAHAIYWSYMAAKVSGGDTSFEALSADRVIYGSLQVLVNSGRLVLTDDSYIPPVLISPAIEFIPVVHRTYLALGQKYAEGRGEQWDGTGGRTFKAGHVNFLRKGIALYYQYGRMDLARKYWKIMTTMYPLREYDVGMVAYIRKEIVENIKTQGMTDTNATINMMLVQACGRYARGDDYTAVGMERLAKTIYEAYMDEGRKWRQPTGRVSLRPWEDIVSQARATALKNLPADLADRLRQRLGIETRTLSQEAK